MSDEKLSCPACDDEQFEDWGDLVRHINYGHAHVETTADG